MNRQILALLLVAGCYRSAPPAPATPANQRGETLFAAHRFAVPPGIQALAIRGAWVFGLSYESELIALRDGVLAYRKRLDFSALGNPAWARLDALGNTLLVSTGDFVLAVDAADGDPRWNRTGMLDRLDLRAAAHGIVHVVGEGTNEWLDARTGATVAARNAPPESPRSSVGSAELSDTDGRRVEVHRNDKLSNKQHWRVEYVAANGAPDFIELEDIVLVNRLDAQHSSVVALDSATGRERWSVALDARGLFLQYAYAGPGFTWVVASDGDAMRDGSIRYVWLAISHTGRVLQKLAAPDRDARYCAVDISWASADGVLAVVHGIRVQGRDTCSVAVVDTYLPRP